MLPGSAASAQGSSQWDWFWWEEVSDGLYLIRESFLEPGKGANIWLVQGSQRDLLIDTGLGLKDLRSYLRSAGLVGSKPLLAVVTHIHFEHSGGLHHFDRVAVHRAEAGALARGNNFETATWLSGSAIKRSPGRGWSARHYRVISVQPDRILDHGDIINLGNRQLTVLHMPGHSRGSICFHDQENRILFSGDVVYDGCMVDWLPSSNISDYIQTCKRLMTLVDNDLVIQVLPGHFDPFDAERLYRLASSYIANAGVCHKILSCATKCIVCLALWLRNYGR
ncbi:acyl-coenzyme A thioesterase MBLAC2 [Mustelus asterias]